MMIREERRVTQNIRVGPARDAAPTTGALVVPKRFRLKMLEALFQGRYRLVAEPAAPGTEGATATRCAAASHRRRGDDFSTGCMNLRWGQPRFSAGHPSTNVVDAGRYDAASELVLGSSDYSSNLRRKSEWVCVRAHFAYHDASDCADAFT